MARKYNVPNDGHLGCATVQRVGSLLYSVCVCVSEANLRVPVNFWEAKDQILLSEVFCQYYEKEPYS